MLGSNEPIVTSKNGMMAMRVRSAKTTPTVMKRKVLTMAERMPVRYFSILVAGSIRALMRYCLVEMPAKDVESTKRK